MRSSRTLVLLSSLSVLAACQASVIEEPVTDVHTPPPERTVVAGDMQPYSGSTVESWASLEEGSVVEVGITVPMTAIHNARVGIPEGADPTIPDSSNSVRLTLPAIVTEQTFIDHFDLDYNPVGHPPMDIYTLPHFDLHFYGISEVEQLAIDCSDKMEIEAEKLPTDYVVGKPGRPPVGECVPMMGHHAVSMKAPELSPENPAVFDKTMVLGYYAGEMTFLEPMVTRDLLLAKRNFDFAIELPKTLPRKTMYPTEFSATFDAKANAYRFVLRGFEEMGEDVSTGSGEVMETGTGETQE
jgi:hypothetical protein